MIYIQIENDATKVIERKPHNIPKKITRVKYLPGVRSCHHSFNASLGTLVAYYSVNGNEELILF